MEEERSIAVEVQQDECEDYAVDVTTASSWYKNVSYDDAKIFIRTNIESAARSFIAIGYYLKLIRDGELYREEGHENIWDFAMAEYGISKSTASRYMSMNDRFSLDGNSPIVDQKYKDFEKSKLQEMLSLTDEQLEQVTPEMKVQEIRAMRQPKEIPYFELEGQMDLETDFPGNHAGSTDGASGGSARYDPDHDDAGGDDGWGGAGRAARKVICLWYTEKSLSGRQFTDRAELRRRALLFLLSRNEV